MSVKPIYVFIPGGDVVVGSVGVTVKNIYTNNFSCSNKYMLFRPPAGRSVLGETVPDSS